MAHAGYNTQSAIIFVLLLPFLFSPSSLYIFLMEFHFLRVLKTCAKKRRCEKKLENTCLPYRQNTSSHTTTIHRERRETGDSFFLVERGVSNKTFFPSSSSCLKRYFGRWLMEIYARKPVEKFGRCDRRFELGSNSLRVELLIHSAIDASRHLSFLSIYIYIYIHSAQ